jgi:hypothetical protein
VRSAPRIAGALIALLVAVAAAAAQDAAPTSKPVAQAAPAPSAGEVRAAIDRGVKYLLGDQNKDGSWGGIRNHTFTDGFGNSATHQAWDVATTGLVCMALLECASKDDAAAPLGRAADFLAMNGDVKRPADWDIDNVWSFTFGLQGITRMIASGRFAGTPREAALRAAAAQCVDGLDRYQSPNGGWAYYANPISDWRPEWATSFTTSAAVLALAEARDAGIKVSHANLEKALKAIRHCRLPTGAFTYTVEPIPSPGRATWIDQVKGSLGRIHSGDLALHKVGGGLPEADRRQALALLAEHHRFLDVALHKPIPHEAYYFNSAYFYLWAHYYGAQVLETLPAADQQTYWPMIRREVMKTQEKDGGFWDFYMSANTKPYGTSFAIMALERSLKPAP